MATTSRESGTWAFQQSLAGRRSKRSPLTRARKPAVECLESHPTETIIMSVDSTGGDIAKMADKRIEDSVRTAVHTSPNGRTGFATQGPLFYTNSSVPTLGEARGQIVLLRRYADASPNAP